MGTTNFSIKRRKGDMYPLNPPKTKDNKNQKESLNFQRFLKIRVSFITNSIIQWSLPWIQ